MLLELFSLVSFVGSSYVFCWLEFSDQVGCQDEIYSTDIARATNREDGRV